MLDWLTKDSEAVSVALDAAMLLVWVVYLQVFVSSYRRQRRANILIGVGGGSGLDAHCLVSNLSQSAIYIRSIVLDLRTAQGTSSHPVTELENLEEWKEPTDLDLWTRQGPLAPGGVRDMGTFSAMLDHALRAAAAPGGRSAPPTLEAVEEVRVTVIAHFGPEDLLVAAEQGYAVVRQGGRTWLHPRAIAPRQIRSRRERERLRARLEQEPRPGGPTG